jgi:hypothetical protein
MKLKRLFLVFIIIVASLSLAKGQDAANNQSGKLTDYLSSIEKKFGVTFSYDSDLLKNVPINTDTTGLNLTEILRQLSNRSAFDLELTNSNIVLVKPKVKGANYKISGRIVDGESKAPLLDCLLLDDEKTISSSSNKDGVFTIYVRYSEDDKITIRYLGYKTLSVPMEVFSSGKSIEFSMAADIMDLEEITVTTYMSSGINYNRLNNSLEIKPENLSLLPGQTDADLLMSVEALPGINSPDGKAGNLNVRGSSSDQTLITFDNIPIYHKGHYFGTLSPFNPKVVENLSVSRGSFTADKGGRVGGSIDIRTKQSVPDSITSGASLSTIDASAYTHIPIVKKKLSLLVAGRTSYPFGWQSPKLKAISDFVFQQTALQGGIDNKSNTSLQSFSYRFNDFNTKLIFQPSVKQKISVSFLKISNQLNAQIHDVQQNSLSKDSIGFSNWGISAQWENRWSEKMVSRVSATNSYYSQKTSHGLATLPSTLVGQDNYKNQANDFNLTTETDFYSKQKHFLKTGYSMSRHDFLYEKTGYIAQQPVPEFKDSRVGYVHSLYSSYNLLFYKLNASIGLRGNYFTLTKKVNPEPRISVNYLINKNLTFKSTWGIQKQFVNQITGLNVQSIGGLMNQLWTLSDGKIIPVVKSNQVMAGVMYERRGWLIDLELYYKKIGDITIININDFYSPNKFFYGSSSTVGADFLIKKRWKKFDAWVSYTLSDSKMKFDSIQAKPFTSILNQRHVLDLDILYQLGKFKFSAGWKYRSGLAALPGIRTKLLHGAPNADPQSTPQPPLPIPGGGQGKAENGVTLYTDHYPAFHQLDISAVYEFPAKKKQWNSSIGFSIQNVYNRKNIIEQFTRLDISGPVLVNRYSIGFAPNLFLTVNF